MFLAWVEDAAMTGVIVDTINFGKQIRGPSSKGNMMKDRGATIFVITVLFQSRSHAVNVNFLAPCQSRTISQSMRVASFDNHPSQEGPQILPWRLGYGHRDLTILVDGKILVHGHAITVNRLQKKPNGPKRRDFGLPPGPGTRAKGGGNQ